MAASARYSHTLCKLAQPQAFPMHAFSSMSDTALQRTEANSRPCVCGERRGQWPWQLQPQSHGFCACDEVFEERSEWVHTAQAWDRHLIG